MDGQGYITLDIPGKAGLQNKSACLTIYIILTIYILTVFAPSGIFNIMNISKKVVNGGLLVYVGGQALAVGAGLAYHYSQPQIAHIVLTVEAQRYTIEDIFNGAIMKPRLSYPDSSQNHTKELGISFIGSTTGLSGDATMVFPV